MMGLAGAKRNKCRRLLTPIEIEGQRHGENRVSNPSLLLWYDFTDKKTLLKASTSQTQPSHGDKVWQAHNQVIAETYVGGSVLTDPYPWASIGEKALGRHVNCGPSNAPFYVESSVVGGLHNGLLFDGTNSFIFGSGTTGPTSGSNFSTSELEFPGITIFVVCQRIDTGSAQTGDVFSISLDSVFQMPAVTVNFILETFDESIVLVDEFIDVVSCACCRVHGQSPCLHLLT